MEIVERLQVRAEDFFNTLADSLAYDVSQAVGKRVTPGQLYDGYRYKKSMKNKLGQSGEVSVTIKRFQPPVAYEASFRSYQGINFISYEIEDLKDGTVRVSYREGFEGKGASQSLNYKLMAWLYQRKAKKRMKRTLKSMEQYIQNAQKNASQE